MTPRTPLEELAEIEREMRERHSIKMLRNVPELNEAKKREYIEATDDTIAAWQTRLAAARGAVAAVEDTSTPFLLSALEYGAYLERLSVDEMSPQAQKFRTAYAVLQAETLERKARKAPRGAGPTEER